ncbi:MepB family protein [Exiguobacterium sp. R-39]|uniref:MepB family protein n=1 Tax=Exiguobacterium sp. R-39 TaxID=3416708 RepID=UPI003CF2FCAC
MNNFFDALAYVQKIMYKPYDLYPQFIQEEVQNSDYSAGLFHLRSKSIRFRVAKTTPKKAGQFVAFWEKDDKNKNQPFSDKTATDLLVVNIFTNDNKFGQFIFPKEVLIKQKILSTNTIKGKMAIRVYPSWEYPTSKQAIATQTWQVEYFVEIQESNSLPTHEIMRLYFN